jgi:hypothetical protein
VPEQTGQIFQSPGAIELLIVPLHFLPFSLAVQSVLGELGLDDVFPQAVQTANGGHFISDISTSVWTIPLTQEQFQILG